MHQQTKKLLAAVLLTILAAPSGWALEINADGNALVQEAGQVYSSDMKGRPVVT